MAKEMVLKLFVAGKTFRSRQTIEGITAAFDECLKEKGTLEIIDLLAQPELTEAEKVLATPTLVRQLPTPARRVIGDFSDGMKALDLLELGTEKP